MNEQVTAVDGKFQCLECRNEVTLDPNKKVGDVIECPFCGIEYEVTAKTDAGATLQIIEEEK
jgi:transcription elongation factor Elf1